MTAKFNAPRGTYDVLPAQARLRGHIERVAASVLESAGYGRIDTPIFEDTDLFTRTVGAATDIVSKEMYTFEDRGRRSLTLRPEGTAPVVRAYVEHGMHKLAQPVKLWYAGPMFRYEAPQSGRFRQHRQIGAEAIGSADPLVDGESIALLGRTYADLGLQGVVLRISSLGDGDCRPEYVRELREFLLATGEFSPEQRERIEANPLRAFDWSEPSARAVTERAPKLVDRLCDSCLVHFQSVMALLDALGHSYVVDPRLVRGLDYYTRTVFEFTCDLLGAQSGIGGGGRYDGLVKQLGGPSVTAVGWATGVERIAMAYERSSEHPGPAVAPRPVAYVVAGATERAAALVLAEELRAHGVATDLDLGERTFKGQMKVAGRLRARYVLILGSEEVASGTVTVKDMETGVQSACSRAAVAREMVIRHSGR